MMVKKEQKLVTILDVKAVLNKFNDDIELIGEASFGRKSKSRKQVDLLDIRVKKAFRRMGIGSKMFTLIIDFAKEDGQTQEIVGEITSADNLEIAINFYKKNHCTIITERLPEGDLLFCILNLKKHQNLQFYTPHKIEPSTEKEYFIRRCSK